MNTVKRAKSDDRERVERFLVQAGLNIEGIDDILDNFFLLENSQKSIVGTLGVEIKGNRGLLRSLAIAPSVPEEDLFTLFETARVDSRDRGLSTIFLATSKATSVALFQFLGFELLDASSFHTELHSFEYFHQIKNVDNCFLMKCKLA
ncbi:hypothetical protein WAK64_18645 [Bacillus spongiae]|uniref:N-acetyltransferase domain-containing protein n=1 Tax=Bacillus spongiae TaxID=2683610 RepID=A0ABU8HIX3_9BACI